MAPHSKIENHSHPLMTYRQLQRWLARGHGLMRDGDGRETHHLSIGHNTPPDSQVPPQWKIARFPANPFSAPRHVTPTQDIYFEDEWDGSRECLVKIQAFLHPSLKESL